MRIETAFDIHDTVFFMDKNKIDSGIVESIIVSVLPTLPRSTSKLYYIRKGEYINEKSIPEYQLFASKEILRQSL